MKAIVDFLINQFGIEISTAVSLVVTISIFTLGIIINETLKLFSKYLERRNTRILLKHTLDTIINSGEKESKLLQQMSSNITFDGMNLFEYTKLEFAGTFLLYDIGYERLFKALMIGPENNIRFIKSFRIKVFSKIWASNRVIKFIHEKAYTDIEHFLDKYNSKNKLRNESINELRKVIFDIQARFDGKEVPIKVSNFFKEIENIYEAWAQLDNRTRPDIVHNKLVIKINDLDNRIRINELTVLINPLLLDSISRYQDQKKFLENHRYQYLQYSKIILASSKLIKIIYPVLFWKLPYLKKSIYNN